MPELAPRRNSEDAWLVQELVFSGSLMRFFPKPVIRLTDFEIRCFSGIKQAR